MAHYLYNCPEYMESTFGILKAGLVPVNTNYRYTDDELVYLWDNADAVVVIFHGAFVERIDGLRPRVPARPGLAVGRRRHRPVPGVGDPLREPRPQSSATRVEPPWARSGDDLYFLYTGGTTGMPKGVMWRQDDLFCRLNAGNLLRVPEDGGIEAVRKTIVGPGPLHLPACPLMHGTGAFTSMAAMTVGGCVVTLTSRRLRPGRAARHHRPREREHRRHRGRRLRQADPAQPSTSIPAAGACRRCSPFVSSGVMWSEETKRGLLHHHPNLMLIDAFSSSEAIGMGTSVSSGTSAEHTAHFTLAPTYACSTPSRTRT